MEDYVQFLSENRLNRCQIFGRFGLKKNRISIFRTSLPGTGIVGFNVPLNTLWVILGMTLWVVWPNQQCHSTEGQWLVNQVKGQSHRAQFQRK